MLSYHHFAIQSLWKLRNGGYFNVLFLYSV